MSGFYVHSEDRPAQSLPLTAGVLQAINQLLDLITGLRWYFS